MYWNWFKGGVALSACFLLAVILIKPIGVSTQFVILDGIIFDFIDKDLVVKDESTKSGYSSKNAYLNKSDGKYAKAVAEPISYGLIFVLSMAVGGFIGGFSQRKNNLLKQVPDFHSKRFSEKRLFRYSLAFIGGVIVILGARLAGGCTSGHMMSGMMQTSISGYLFALAAFAVAVPTAILIYRNKTE
jgi:uncharacterized protein